MKEMNYKLLVLLLIMATFPLFSQEDVGEQPAPPPAEQLYVISGFEFNITGRTRPDALIRNTELQTGEELRGEAELEKYIRDKTQELINQRVLKDNVALTYAVGEPTEDGSLPVTVTVSVEDSWNLIALPKPGYSTNTGFELTIKARDYNFLGTMNPLRIDLGYFYDENRQSSFVLGVTSDTPFKAFGYDWNIRFDNNFSYRPNVEEPFYYQNITGLSMKLPFRRTTFTFGFEESTNWNEENSDRYKENYGDFQNGLYMSSKLFTSWEIPTGLLIPQAGELTYNPEISATFNHEFPAWSLDEFRQGPFLRFTHSLGFEKIDWHANYRKGYSASIGNSYTYDFFRLSNNEDPLSVTLTLSGIGHFIISEFFGISSRLQYRHWFYHDPDYYGEAGDNLRGIADKALQADSMLSLNIDLPLRALLFLPSKWLNTSKVSFFDFELQASPVIDIALYRNPATGESFHPKNTAVSGGIELVVFPLFMRNLYIRLGYAINLREFFTARPIALPDGDNREIYLIMGHFY